MHIPRINLISAYKTEPSAFGKLLALAIIGTGIFVLCLGGGILSLPVIAGGMLCLKDEFQT